MYSPLWVCVPPTSLLFFKPFVMDPIALGKGIKRKGEEDDFGPPRKKVKEDNTDTSVYRRPFWRVPGLRERLRARWDRMRFRNDRLGDIERVLREPEGSSLMRWMMRVLPGGREIWQGLMERLHRAERQVLHLLKLNGDLAEATRHSDLTPEEELDLLRISWDESQRVNAERLYLKMEADSLFQHALDGWDPVEEVNTSSTWTQNWISHFTTLRSLGLNHGDIWGEQRVQDVLQQPFWMDFTSDSSMQNNNNNPS